MGANEEYLDNLLKSMGDEETDIPDDPETFSADIDAMFAALEQSGELTDSMGENEEAETQLPQPEEMPEMPEMTESAPTVESTQDMGQDEIEQMLAFAGNEEASNPNTQETVSEDEQSLEDVFGNGDAMDPLSIEESAVESPSEEELVTDQEEKDILALLDSIQDDEGVSEINELLTKADNNEAVDESIFDEGEAESAAAEISALLGEGEEGASLDEEQGTGRKKKKEKKEKPKKEKVKKEPDGEEKEPKEPKESGFFGKLFSKLTEEVEPISEENENIMKELEAEDAVEADKPKKIKKGLLPGKKGDEEGEDSGNKSKKGNKKGPKKDNKKEKPKKEQKPKKEKPVKEPAVPEKPGKKISKASMIVILLFAGTIFGIVFFASTFLSGMLQKQRAHDAFAKQDYMSCYEDLYGLDRSEEEELMFHHARTVLKVERRLIRYENYLEDYQMLEALDTLMQALADYDDLYAEAQSYGAEAEVNAYYARIYEILERDYGLSRESAHAIADCDNKVDYTRYLTALAAGEHIAVSGSEEGLPLPETPMQDILPAEEELLPPAFID